MTSDCNWRRRHLTVINVMKSQCNWGRLNVAAKQGRWNLTVKGVDAI